MATQLHSETVASPPPDSVGVGVNRNRSSSQIRPSAKKKLIRRTNRDYSQRLRRGYQCVFLLMNLWLGGQFYIWVRHFETAGRSAYVSRPAGVEGWLPIAGLMNLKYFLGTGRAAALHPAAMFLLITFLAMALLFRKAFCSWLCPVGTVSEYLGKLGQKLFHRNFRLPHRLDVSLRGLKYLLLAFFVWAVSTMSVNAIAAFMHSPYGMVADVKMLNFFRFMGETGWVVLGVLVLAALFMQNFWCRYLCPYGALLGIASLFRPLRIRRAPETCIDCAKCGNVCPSSLPVDQLISIKSADCTGCLECLAVCPAEGALEMAVPQALAARTEKKGGMPAWAFAVGVAALFFGIVGFAKTEGHWNSDIPQAVYQKLVPHANEAAHPMPGNPVFEH
jgi:polyferredoxin